MISKGKLTISQTLLASTVLTALALPTVATAAAPTTAFEEIVVTSRKREERLQSVPESVTVFTPQKIENANITTLRGFVDLTPNLLVRETFRTNETFLTMRGIASAQGALPPVAFVIDGVQLGSNDFINQDLMDIQQIEVLKGPQGTLYGQGAIAGAVVVTTKEPTNELEGLIKGSYGNANSFRVAAAVSGPIVEDKLFARVSGYYRESDGLIKSAAGERITPEDQASIRGRLEYRGERLKLSLRGSYTDGDGYCCFLDKVPLNPPPLVGSATMDLSKVDDVTNPGFTGNLLGTEETSFRDISFKIDYDFDGVTVTSITAYAEVRQYDFGDGDYTSSPAVAQDLNFDQDVFNQELRFTSTGEGPLQWIFGGFYQDRQERQRVIVGAENPTNPQGGLPSGSILNQNNVTNREAWALFGQASYDITEKLNALVGLRYDHDKQNNENTLAAVSNFADATFTQVQPKVQLSYKWTEDFLSYITYSTGFRSGGYTQNTEFDNEVSRNYELGFKGTFLDSMLIVNASAFYTDLRDQQLSFVVVTPTEFRRGVVNIPKTDIHGMELEVQAQPMENLDLTAGIGVSETTIREVTTVDSALGDVSSAVGKHSPLVPGFTFNFGATYTVPVSDGMDVVIHGDYRRHGGYYFDLVNTIRTQSADFFSGRLALEGENWSVAAWGKNLSNTRRATRVSETGNRLRTPNMPRSYGLEATYKF